MQWQETQSSIPMKNWLFISLILLYYPLTIENSVKIQSYYYIHIYIYIYIYICNSNMYVICNIYIHIYIYIVIHHWRILESSYRKLAWVGFKSTTTESHSGTLTDWPIRPWALLALRANLVQLHQFHRLFSVRFRFGYCLRHVCFNRNFLEVMIWV